MPRPATVLTPELLKTFVTLVRCEGSVARTSELLDINEASVSKRIKPLHEGAPPDLPRPWLEKRGKLFVLTEEGKLLLPAAEDQLRRWEHFVDFVEAGRLGQLSVGCGRDAITGIVFEAVKRWRNRFPDYVLNLSTPRGKNRIEAVAAGLLDLALVTHDEAQIRAIARKPLLIDRLSEDPLVLVYGQRGKWARTFSELPETGVTPAQLEPFPLLLPEKDSGLRAQFDRVLFDAGVLDRIHPALEIGGWTTLLSYANEGMGVGLVPQSFAERNSKSLTIRKLATDFVLPNTLRLIGRPLDHIHSPDQWDLSEAGQEFRRCLKAEG